MDKKIAWIEIPAQNIKRAIIFYEKILNTKLEVQIVLDKPIAVLDEKIFGVKGCIIENENFNGTGGIKLVLKVNIMYESVENVEKLGGKIIVPSTLLKQRNSSGDLTIGKNLIDGEVGYICEITDSEGNGLFLYSHS